jgi:hypothetical protein
VLRISLGQTKELSRLEHIKRVLDNAGVTPDDAEA